jgi:hypothetical protein
MHNNINMWMFEKYLLACYHKAAITSFTHVVTSVGILVKITMSIGLLFIVAISSYAPLL